MHLYEIYRKSCIRAPWNEREKQQNKCSATIARFGQIFKNCVDFAALSSLGINHPNSFCLFSKIICLVRSKYHVKGWEMQKRTEGRAEAHSPSVIQF